MDKDLLKKDLYEAVNGEWLETAEIPADKSATGGFQDLVDEIDELLMKDTEKMATDSALIPSKEMQNYISYFKLANDYAKRDAEGAAPLLPMIEKIKALTGFEELNQQITEWFMEGLPLPFSLSVDADMKNTQVNALWAGSAGTILPDKTYYEAGNESGEQLMNVFFQMTVQLLEMTGIDKKEAEAITEEAIAFDKIMAPFTKSAEESADYSKIYNPQDFDTFTSHSSKLAVAELLEGLLGTQPKKIIVMEPEYFEALNIIVSNSHFELMKHWMLVQVVTGLSGYLSEEFRQVGGTYSRALSGAPEAKSQKKAAYYLASGQFDHIIGDYYGHKYFGEEAKQDVRQMVQTMVEVYKKRLSNNTWLSDSTREKAVLKLTTLGIQVGYPDKIPAVYYEYQTVPAEEGGTLFSNVLNFSKIALKDHFSKWNQPVDRDEWEMSADTVNAYYHPFRNIIVFPAAILQAPFYSLKQSKSANYGGIGAVIAHEISHAFDNNGCLFDEYGNMNNWWTDEDSEHFKELAQAMVEEFDGIEFAGGKINGKLTVSENIADAGGLSCALEACKLEEEADLAEFFTNWARIWRMKAREEYMQLLLNIDVHSPAKLRANVQVKNLDDFYTTFDVKEDDEMYLTPEKRVSIW